MADDPKSKAGRAEMLRRAKEEEAEAAAAAKAWAQTAREVEALQRRSGDS